MDLITGDLVKAIDSNGNLINSEIVSIMHKNTNATNIRSFSLGEDTLEASSGGT